MALLAPSLRIANLRPMHGTECFPSLDYAAGDHDCPGVTYAPLMRHLQSRLRYTEKVLESVRAADDRNGAVITVKKLERREDPRSEQRDAQMKQWRKTLKPLRGSTFKVVLRDEDYRRFVDPWAGRVA